VEAAMTDETTIAPFAVKDCALVAISTGRRARNLRELCDGLQTIHPESIYYHFWGILLRPHFEDPEYNNDFASWVRHALHDSTLAERLGVIDPAEFGDLEGLRQKLVAVLEERLDETESPSWTRLDQQFHFVRSQTVVFDTGRRIRHPRELPGALPTLSLGSVYYHVIDARRREPLGVDDLRVWLGQWSERYAGLRARLAAVDPYFVTLTELRAQITGILCAPGLEEPAP
jgi:hypothetical protein